MDNTLEPTMGLNLNFADVTVPTGNFLEPGQYRTTVSKVELEDATTKATGVTKKVLKVTFKTKDEKEFTETFYLVGDTADKTRKALGRLQYLHQALFGQTISENFSSYEDMADYFKAKLMKKGVEVLLLVGGDQQEDEKVYSRLGFTGFIFAGNPKDFVEIVYEKGTAEYNRVVSKKKTTAAGAAVMGTGIPVLNPAAGAQAAMPWDK